MRQSLREFIRKNRKEIDEAIGRVCSGLKLNDEQREQWIRNDQGLYNWARSEGVRLRHAKTSS
jgi:hypothetical protein